MFHVVIQYAKLAALWPLKTHAHHNFNIFICKAEKKITHRQTDRLHSDPLVHFPNASNGCNSTLLPPPHRSDSTQIIQAIPVAYKSANQPVPSWCKYRHCDLEYYLLAQMPTITSLEWDCVLQPDGNPEIIQASGLRINIKENHKGSGSLRTWPRQPRTGLYQSVSAGPERTCP